jgi:hypothetical protein
MTMGLKLTILPLVLASLAATGSAADSAADWPQWRGPNGNGTSSETGIVSTWSPTTLENVVFRISHVGRSTPAVFDGRVCASGRADSRYETIGCYSARDGVP